MARKKKATTEAVTEAPAETETVQSAEPEVETAPAPVEPDHPLAHLEGEPIALVAEGTPAEAPATFTEEQQSAYAAASMSTGERNVKGYDDIHDWYRRTKGGQEDA